MDDEPILREHVKNGVVLPDFYLAVGTEDFIYSLSQKTRAIMAELGLNFTYEEGPGIHDWDFWDEYIQHAIKWLNLKNTTVVIGIKNRSFCFCFLYLSFFPEIREPQTGRRLIFLFLPQTGQNQYNNRHHIRQHFENFLCAALQSRNIQIQNI